MKKILLVGVLVSCFGNLGAAAVAPAEAPVSDDVSSTVETIKSAATEAEYLRQEALAKVKAMEEQAKQFAAEGKRLMQEAEKAKQEAIAQGEEFSKQAQIAYEKGRVKLEQARKLSLTAQAKIDQLRAKGQEVKEAAARHGFGWQDAALTGIAAAPVLGLGAYNYWQARKRAQRPKYGLYQALGLRPGAVPPSQAQIEQAYQQMHQQQPSQRLERAHALLTRGRTGSDSSAASFRDAYHRRGDRMLPESQFAAMLSRMKNSFMGRNGAREAVAHWATPAFIAALIAGRYGVYGPWSQSSEAAGHESAVESTAAGDDSLKGFKPRTIIGSLVEKGRARYDAVLSIPNVSSSSMRKVLRGSSHETGNYSRILRMAIILRHVQDKAHYPNIPTREVSYEGRSKIFDANERANLRAQDRRKHWFNEQLVRLSPKKQMQFLRLLEEAKI